MNDLEKPTNYTEEITLIHNSTNSTLKEKIASLYSLFKKVLVDFLENDKQYFSNDFARLIYISDRFHLSDELKADLRLMRYIGRNISRLDKRYDGKNYAFTLKTVFDLIHALHNIKAPKILSDFLDNHYQRKPFAVKSKESQERIQFTTAVVLGKGQKFHKEDKTAYAEIFCESEELGEFTLLVNGMWIDIYQQVWPTATINVFELKRVKKDKQIFRTSINSIIILEPDYLIDVTDLAECFQFNGANVYLYFLKRFTKHKTSLAMVAGNIINSCFDELLENPDSDVEEIYYKALKIKPLQVFAIAKDDPHNAIKLKEKAIRHLGTLKNVLKDIEEGIFSAEPSFISPVYGLQGRLDVLIEYEDQPNRKDIIELKSGSAPSPDLSIKTNKGYTIKTGLWPNHLIQTTCYNLLLDSAFDKRTGSSQILYSSTDVYPLRNAENILNKKQEAIYYRNWIISLEMALIQGHYSLLASLNPDDFGHCPSYTKQDIYDFAFAYHSANDIERQYFNAFTTFISKEIYSSKCGNESNRNNNGFSSLWKSSFLEKEAGYQILSRLKLIEEESDFDNLHLCFEIIGNNNSVSSFRKGDIGILYPYSDDPEFVIYKQQIIKCHIKSIGSKKISISIRNKLFRKDKLFENDLFSFEPDYIDSTGKALYRSLFQLLSSSREKRELILGMKEPEFSESIHYNKTELTDEQNALLSTAVSAKDYFLIQGPPGTGKTSFMLRSIIETIYSDSNETILVTAYTNRAVDEICSSIKRSEMNIDFIRLGTKESSIHNDNLLYQLSLEKDIKELYKYVNRIRVIVSTTSSLLSNPEIFELKKFDTLIIDEASQILEPQIVGIITQAARFIMIGDEKQLPAVVTQKDIFYSEQYPKLQDIGLNSLSGSLFERLLNICQQNYWHNGYGMLSKQARMVDRIQELANHMFYSGRLSLFEILKLDHKIISPANNIIFNKNVVFIDSAPEETIKTHYGEAKIAANLASEFLNNNEKNDMSVGIISPFRAQCSLIKSMLGNDNNEKITVDTVERYQGSERDVIIISFAVNYKYQIANIQSLVENNGELLDRKLNVALTRAKKNLIIIGCSDILTNSPVYEKLIHYIKENETYIRMNDLFSYSSIKND